MPVQKKASSKLTIVYHPVLTLKSHPKNVRLHSEENIAAITASLKEYGQRKPIVLDADMQVICGNGTLEGAKRLSWSEIACCHSGLSGLKAESFAIADNKTTDMSEFDFEALADTFKRLDGEGLDLSLTGFAKYELEPLMSADFIPHSEDAANNKDTSTVIKFTPEQMQVIQPVLDSLKENQDFDVSTPAACLTVLAYLYNSGGAANVQQE